ncbi:hypothetical protein AVEN_203964-1 [Araneus ventricosus]|uniref:ATP-dependent DNA helicase n=1 Tax=Araneus ventricosus TaxID=182803 RepID=A0A4Y2R9B7_ARAVE|nr:hypothetical protein AVEN_140474-1 [Araneus ventricosus]GBN71892.1 hypothetical protein AVEN_162187-1 [Araneus ventricosus]GBO10133.1 hypothetical protein AVEN_74504-1 [Araneus ventricosus]GBO10139.1 hypothetical protein AVEN_203964-1 [Araneus ventricosus]
MAQVLPEAKVTVWDECYCTVVHKRGIEALNRAFQDVRGHHQIMGGVTVFLAGDFRQTLPVVSRAISTAEVTACFKSSILWSNVKILSLRINMRVDLQSGLKAEEFSNLLVDIVDGNVLEQ